MKARNTPAEFTLIKIEPFDARHGMVRCSIPGIGVSVEGMRGGAVADFWKDKYGQLAVRITCSGDPSPVHFVAALSDGRPCYEGKALRDFADYINAVLLGWATRGNKGYSGKVAPRFLRAFKDGGERLLNKFDTNLLWENDASSVPMTYKREQRIKLATFETFQSRGYSPEKLKDKKIKAEYAAWIKLQE